MTVRQPDTRGPAPDELQVQIRAPTGDVPEQPPEAIDAVKPAVSLQPHHPPRRQKLCERLAGFCGIALAATQFRRIDLHEANAPSVAKANGVAVDPAAPSVTGRLIEKVRE